VTGLRWLRATLAEEAQVEPLVRLRAEVGLAQLAFIAGDYLASFTAIESALPAARRVGDDVVLARCLATAGYVWWLLDPERSAALFEEGLEAAGRSGDGWTRSIDYSTAGDGPPVLLICGTGQPADLWFAQVADLTAAGHTVITFDNRGCGRSEAPPAPYLVADMAADTAALIEHLGLGPCDIIGYSLDVHRPGTRRDPR